MCLEQILLKFIFFLTKLLTNFFPFSKIVIVTLTMFYVQCTLYWLESKLQSNWTKKERMKREKIKNILRNKKLAKPFQKLLIIWVFCSFFVAHIFQVILGYDAFHLSHFQNFLFFIVFSLMMDEIQTFFFLFLFFFLFIIIIFHWLFFSFYPFHFYVCNCQYERRSIIIIRSSITFAFHCKFNVIF